MKQNKILTIGLIVSALVISGCSDSFLEVTSPTQEFVDTYYNDEAHIAEAVIAAYDPLHWSDWAMNEYNPLLIMSDIMADDLWVGGQDRTDNQAWHLMMNYEAIPTNVIKGLWTVAYSGVKRCNDVLGYIAKADEGVVSEENEKYFTAQVVTLRALYYTWLWKFWGNIPYYSENLTVPYIAEQYKADDVYANIVADLESVLDDKDVLPMRETSENYGRITRAMAQMLYAEVVMYQNDESRFNTALGHMLEIINSGEYSLLPEYSEIFKESGEWSSESIFEINYTDKNAVRSWNGPLVAGGTVLPTLISPHNWADGTDGHDQGWGFCPVRLETVALFVEGDERGPATCWNAAAAADAAGTTYNKRYQDTGYFLEKYVAHSGDNSEQKADPQLNWNNNWRIYRYSETLLNAAELIARGAKGGGDAALYLKMVRERAGLTTTVAPSVENILNERHLEFVGEGKRYWDLIRSGEASKVLVPDGYGYRTNSWTPNKKYLPIHQSEIDAAQGTLIQNEY